MPRGLHAGLCHAFLELSIKPCAKLEQHPVVRVTTSGDGVVMRLGAICRYCSPIKLIYARTQVSSFGRDITDLIICVGSAVKPPKRIISVWVRYRFHSKQKTSTDANTTRHATTRPNWKIDSN